MSAEQIEKSRGEGGKLVNNVLQATTDHGGAVLDNLTVVEALPGVFCLAASPRLLALEERLKAQWLLNKSGPDGRFILREALHSAAVQERFDWVLIDCPPRPTAACMSAGSSRL